VNAKKGKTRLDQKFFWRWTFEGRRPPSMGGLTKEHGGRIVRPRDDLEKVTMSVHFVKETKIGERNHSPSSEYGFARASVSKGYRA